MRERKTTVLTTLLATLTIAVILLPTLGCAKHVAAPVPGQLNTYDAYAYRILFDAQAALNAFRADVTSGKVTETPTIKAYFNQAATDYNTANAVYQGWRAAGGTGSTSTVTVAITKVQTDITNIASAVTAGK